MQEAKFMSTPYLKGRTKNILAFIALVLFVFSLSGCATSPARVMIDGMETLSSDELEPLKENKTGEPELNFCVANWSKLLNSFNSHLLTTARAQGTDIPFQSLKYGYKDSSCDVLLEVNLFDGLNSVWSDFTVKATSNRSKTVLLTTVASGRPGPFWGLPRALRIVYNAFIPGSPLYKKVAEEKRREQVEQGEAKAKAPQNAPAVIVPLPIRSDVDDPPATKAKANKNAYAIVIGIEQYRQKLPKADYAVHDAETVARYLTSAMGYPEENVVTLTNDRAAKSDMEKYFDRWLLNNVEKDASVFIYYSGHGAPNPKTGDAYLVPYDGDPSFINETGYSLKRLYEQLGKLPAKEIVVALDSCFSGAGGRSVLAKGARPIVMQLDSPQILSGKIAVMAASSGDQISSTYDEKGHGLFTYFMLKGIKGEAEANGRVELRDLFDYVKPQVERIARKQYNNEQSPELIAPKGLSGLRLR